MKGFPSAMLVFVVLGLALLAPGTAMAQTEQTAAVSNAPISQPLIREGDFAIKLVDALKLGKAADETEAESTLGSAGIAPKNGWIADYPVTPDITGELQASISEAADSGKLPLGRDEALAAFQGVLAGYNLPVKAAAAEEAAQPAEANYPDTAVINNYYYNEGPPVVTYYAPPPDYAYLYTWVPYPFWWWNFWYPGFFVLVDFDIVVHGRFHHPHREFISNHFHDPRTGRTFRVDPTNRARGGIFTQRGARVLSRSAQRGAQSIMRRGAGRAGPGTYGQQFRGGQFRGYGAPRPSPGTRSSAFERWARRRFGRAAREGITFKRLNEKTFLALIGKDGWTFPIPVIRSGKSWIFFTGEGRQEIINRRIGRNELNTVQTSLAYVRAQREYAKMVRGDKGVSQYAQRFISHKGRRDGLYWPGRGDSPLGPFFARAAYDGNASGQAAERPVPYYGYYFHILKSQGGHVPGGEMDYVAGGRMTAGFGLVAYPARYGVSGIMTFVVNQQGVLYEKDLGPGTVELAKKIKTYDPDQTWKKVGLTEAALSR
ncbi:MAG: DUF2950 family protein [Nitrospiraceae bacterium]|nr:DUF2950 family protein [Nitrospiraceae bacterium]